MPSGEFSIICLGFLNDFWRKSQKNEKLENLACSGSFATAKSTHAAARLKG